MPRSPAALVIAALLFAAAGPVSAARGNPAVSDAAAPAQPSGRSLIDSAGRRVMLPEIVRRVLPAGRNALVLLYALAPDKLPPALRRRPGRMLEWARTPAGIAAAARQSGADLIIDAGPVSPQRAAFANQVQQLAGIPDILVDDSFVRMPQMLRAMGAVLGVEDRAQDLGLYAQHAISGLRGLLLITPSDNRPRVYFALGPDGLTTALPGSPADAALEEAGVINAATSLGRDAEAAVGLGQLIAWNPSIIIAAQRSAYERLRRDPALRGVAAMRDKRVYLQPTYPFGWIADPPGINRLIGLHWLSTLLYPAATQEDIRTDVCDFYDRFYRIKLTNAEVEALVRPAGIPPAAGGRNLPEPLVGLGAAPPSSLAPVAPLPPGMPETPSGMSPSTLTGIPGLPNTAPTAVCAIPTAPTPVSLPGLAPVPGMPAPPAAPPSGTNP
ncbi:MAG TPA: ABC transporter substrate-binding protein [Stellaceae bacterium]|nr:ABC transporter substrate-binding protein [Stellaceae bacterium]